MPNSRAKGPQGNVGPNDNGYINGLVRAAAVTLQAAIEIYCEGHYSHSNARLLPHLHPFATALRALAKTDKETARYANKTHDPALFVPYEPPEENCHRWKE